MVKVRLTLKFFAGTLGKEKLFLTGAVQFVGYKSEAAGAQMEKASLKMKSLQEGRAKR